MIRTRITALVVALALFGALAFSIAAPAQAEDTVVTNKTATPVWITLYADVNAFGWAITLNCRPNMAGANGGQWKCHRETINKDGPWKLRFEVDANGRRYDESTAFWFDGRQKQFTHDGNSNFFVCSDAKGYYWTYAQDCKRL